MKKFLLLTAVAMTAMTSISAQEFQPLGGFIFEKAAEDGHYFTFYNEGTVYVVNRDDFYGEAQEIEVDIWTASTETPDAYYATGAGNIFSNDYIMVGNYNDETPAYLDATAKQWYMLPVKEGDNEKGKCNSADAITPDGKRICGGIALDKFGMDAQDPMMIPVLWEKGENGEYGTYTVLPHPTKDFTGRTPQYVTARAISADGKTIVGQVVDYYGGFPIPIVYTENEAGEWSYKMVGSELVYDTTAVFPPYPSYEPKMPEPTSYMTEEMYNSYLAAVAAYEDSVDNYYEGVIDYYPSYYPLEKDFLTGDALEAFTTAYTTYENEFAAYADSCNTFNAVFYDYDVVYGANFEFNNIFVSNDGKYLVSTYNREYEDPDSWFGFSLAQQSVRFDLTAGTYETSADKTVLSSAVMRDGSVIYNNPADDLCRTAYVWAVGAEKGIELSEYICTRNDSLGKIFQNIMTLTPIEYDPETYEPVEGTPRVISGTAACNAEGTLFYGWLYNTGTVKEMEDMPYFTYFLDLKQYGTTAINEIAADAQIVSTVITDLNGRTVTTSSLKSLPQGSYIMTSTAANGSTKTAKINVH